MLSKISISEFSGLLELQTKVYGIFNIPFISDILKDYCSACVLDVGTGEGSFLLKLAEKNPNTKFTGIEIDPGLFKISQARLMNSDISNVELYNKLFDRKYSTKHDVIISRFVLQHHADPLEYLDMVFNSLNDNGTFICIEPVYDYYDCAKPEAIWKEFRNKMLKTYKRWGSNPNIPKQICKYLSDACFTNIHVSINLYSHATIDRASFNSILQNTVTWLTEIHPDIWEKHFIRDLLQWLDVTDSFPYITIANIKAMK
ncbi:class I SAM-dependent methyltransferase [candidate division KSB1 bacterium]